MEYCNELERVRVKGCKCLLTSYNAVTSDMNNQVGLPLVEHDTRYANADEYLRVLYK